MAWRGVAWGRPHFPSRGVGATDLHADAAEYVDQAEAHAAHVLVVRHVRPRLRRPLVRAAARTNEPRQSGNTGRVEHCPHTCSSGNAPGSAQYHAAVASQCRQWAGTVPHGTRWGSGAGATASLRARVRRFRAHARVRARVCVEAVRVCLHACVHARVCDGSWDITCVSGGSH